MRCQHLMRSHFVRSHLKRDRLPHCCGFCYCRGRARASPNGSNPIMHLAMTFQPFRNSSLCYSRAAHNRSCSTSCGFAPEVRLTASLAGVRRG
jgi:hypothetical protein